MAQGTVLSVAKSLYLCDGHLGFTGGKIDLMGIFDSIAVPSYPFIQPYFVVFARLNQGFGSLSFWVEIRFANTSQLLTSSHINWLVFPNRDIVVNMAMTMNGVSFPRAGLYLVELFIENQWVADTTLELK